LACDHLKTRVRARADALARAPPAHVYVRMNVRHNICGVVRCSVLQCVTVCCSVLQCVVVCCSLQGSQRIETLGHNLCVCTACACVFKYVCMIIRNYVCVAVRCSVLQCVAICKVIRRLKNESLDLPEQ